MSIKVGRAACDITHGDSISKVRRIIHPNALSVTFPTAFRIQLLHNLVRQPQSKCKAYNIL